MKIIIGAKNTSQNGWISTDVNVLDIRNYANWQRLFYPNSLDAVLTDHVLEHLTPSEAMEAAQNVYTFLKPGGYWRIAVPDANNPNPVYHDWCAPGGTFRKLLESLQPNEVGHKQFYNLESLQSLLHLTGFDTKPREFYLAGVAFQAKWNNKDGQLRRTYDSDYAKLHGFLGFENTSLIVDGYKPL